MPETNKAILILGCFDTKGEDFSFLRECIVAQGENVVTINTIKQPQGLFSDIVIWILNKIKAVTHNSLYF